MGDNTKTIVTQETSEGYIHAYTEEEKSAIVEHINLLLENEPQLSYLIPVNPHDESIFKAVRDGVLIWYGLPFFFVSHESMNEFVLSCFLNIQKIQHRKLFSFFFLLFYSKVINAIQPDTIEKITIKEKITNWEIVENHERALKKLPSLGIKVVSLGPTDLMEGKLVPVLGLLWQLVRLDLLSKVGYISHHTKVEWMEEDKNYDLRSEDILLKWFNYQLEKANHSRRVSNFHSDLKDSELYSVLLHQLDNKCKLINLNESDLLKRAETVLEEADKINCRKFISAKDIVGCNQRLNVAFVANLFYQFNKIVDEVEEDYESDTEIEIESAPDELTMNIAKVELEIERLQRELQESEQHEKQEQEKHSTAEKLLKMKEKELQDELNREREKNNHLIVEQDSEIAKLRAKLKELEEEALTADTLGDEGIKAAIAKEVNEKQAIVEEQKKLEADLEALREQLEESEGNRLTWERRRREKEEEIKKLKQRHQIEFERLKKRLVDAKMEVEKLDVELEVKTQEKEKTEEEVFQLRRTEGKLQKTLDKEISYKERISSAKKELEKQLNIANNELKNEKTNQNIEMKARVKLNLKLTKQREMGEELKVKKTDLQIHKRVLEEQSEDLKDQLEDISIEHKVLTRINNQLNEEVDEFQDELTKAEEERADELRRIKKTQQYAIDKLKRDLTTEQRKDLMKKNKIEDEAIEIQDALLEESVNADKLQLQQERIQLESKELSKQLLLESQLLEEAKEDSKLAERDLSKTQQSLDEEKKVKKERENAIKRLQLQNKKLKAKSQEEREANQQLERETELIEKQRHEVLLQVEEENIGARALRSTAKELEKNVELMSSELQDIEKAKEKEAQIIAKKQQEEVDKINRTSQRAKERAERESKKLQESSVELENQIEATESVKLKLESQLQKAEKDIKGMERKLISASSEKLEAEKYRKKLEKELKKAQNIITPSTKTKSTAKLADLTLKKAEKTSRQNSDLLKEMEEDKATVEELQRQVEEAKQTIEDTKLDQQLQSSAADKAKRDLEAKLSALTAEFDMNLDSKKKQTKQKHSAKKDELKKKVKREKEKLDKTVKSLDTKEQELLEEIEQERRAKEQLLKETNRNVQPLSTQ